MSLAKAQIGKCGELLVQYHLLLRGIESAPMSTDTGIDLVTYSPRIPHPITIQVKTNLKSKPGGGKGKLALDWWIPNDSPAHYIALVDLSTEKIWLMTLAELRIHAQQQPEGRLHIYMYTDSSAQPRRTDRLFHAHEFDFFKLENRSSEIFGEINKIA
ncbi:hypothetical protein KW830_05485 [Comamonas sp. CMM03]|uniref:hypothetical protein n=1 Tax=Comamonas sp. CMM03 TaxID=2854781 RepID=UPI001C48EB7E|nr:hypothetical protein [Comamonas sp. CMM03]MBV7417904.1 hypothetical protein [Comamonas sp. CMM03]